jgi:hypothetical protein
MARYKLGRLPRDHSRYAPMYEHYRAAELPVVARSTDVDRATKVSAWPMYANGPDPGNPAVSPDGVGDCTVAGIAHVISAMAVYSGHAQPLFADTEIIRVYSAVSGYNSETGTGDNGANMQTVLDYIKASGITDTTGKVHKVAGYAALGNPKDTTLLAEVLDVFGAAYVGINCPASAQSEFGGTWTWNPFSPIEGGHAIGLHRREPLSVRGPMVYSTWGALQPASVGFAKHYTEEAWAVVSADWLSDSNGESPEGLNVTQLLSDMTLV